MTTTDLMILSDAELLELQREIATRLPQLLHGSAERENALATLETVRREIARRRALLRRPPAP